MSALAFTNQKERLEKTFRNALDAGASFEAFVPEHGHYVIMFHRPDGKRCGLRILGISSMHLPALESGAPLSFSAVRMEGGPSFLATLLPFLHRRAFADARVRIDSGAARLEFVFQDAEWWEEEAPAEGR